MRLRDLRLFGLELRVEVIVLLVALLVFGHGALSLSLLLVILVHESAHALTARRFGGARGRPLLQLGGGSIYVRELARPEGAPWVLLAGSAASLGLTALAAVAARLIASRDPVLASGLRTFANTGLLWSLGQLVPLPPLDGGALLLRWLTKRSKSATRAWMVTWLFGLGVLLGIVILIPTLFPFALYLLAAALLLGRADAAYVRHSDAFEAWSAGDFRGVLARVERFPDYLDSRDRIPVVALGVHAALELADEAALERLVPRLSAGHPAVVAAAEWLLRRGRPMGARFAERAFDALDAERVRPEEFDRDRWADLAFHLASFEASELRPESALGLLERALALGFSHRDRLEAEPALMGLASEPRLSRIIAELDG